jgi:MoxR-like ATPase
LSFLSTRPLVSKKGERLPGNSILRQLGAIGLEAVEPVILAALVNRDPLLLIGPHGCGKSWLLNLIAAALQIEQRHYNASLLNFDDLVGYPLPDANGQLRFIQTPASIWGAQAVFIDEISRCRPEIQNKLFSIIHERRVQGLPLERLEHRWSAMNPPAGDDDRSAAYAGSEPLDQALADRFAFIVEIPGWEGFSEPDQLDLIQTGQTTPSANVGARLAGTLSAARTLSASIRKLHGAGVARYIRLVCVLLRQGQLALSGRRAVQLVRNITAVHAIRQLADPTAAFADSALLALAHSLPQRATGEAIPAHKLLPAHREAWKAAQTGPSSPMAALLAEPDLIRRAILATRIPKLRKSEFSGVITDCLTQLPAGARHALAAELFESGSAGRLVAAAASQCAEWYAPIAAPQEIRESVTANGTRHIIWQQVVRTLSRLDPADTGTSPASNLLVGLFAAGEFAVQSDVITVFEHWTEARRKILQERPR